MHLLVGFLVLFNFCHRPKILKDKKLQDLSKQELVEVLDHLDEMERGEASQVVTECLKRLMK
jgi:hypothetical protein